MLSLARASGRPLNVLVGRSLGERFLDGSPVVRPVNVVDIVILDTLRSVEGIAPGDTITLIGQDGLNCALVLWDNVLPAGDDFLFQVFGRRYEGGVDQGLDYDAWEISGCGPSIVPVLDGFAISTPAFGAVAVGEISMDLASLESDEYSCLNSPPPQRCECDAFERTPCEISQLAVATGNTVNVVRGDYYRRRRPTVNSLDQYAELRTLVVTEVYRGTLSVGDTIDILSASVLSCYPSDNWTTWSLEPFDDVFALFGAVDPTGGTNTPDLGYQATNLPVAPVLDCGRSIYEINGGSVNIPGGSLGLNSTVAQLGNCIPLADQIVSPTRIGLRAYPNPASDRLTISWQDAEVKRIELLDLQGRVVSISAPRSVRRSVVLELSDYPPGVYFARLTTKLGTSTQKIIVQR